MTERTDIVVIGGGVIGMSIAYYCARAGIGVTVVEKGTPGHATTAQTARVVRSYFPGRAHDTALAARSLDEYRALANAGAPLDLSRTGFLVVLTHDEQVERLIAELPFQQAAGASVEMVTAERAIQLNPLLDPTGIKAAVWSPQAFSCDPQEIVNAFAAGAVRSGARLLNNTSVDGLDADAGEVQTTVGKLKAGAVVCAAGPWSGDIAAMAGMELPVAPRPSELMISDVIDFPITPPFTLHPESQLRTRRLGESLLVGLEGIPKSGDERATWHRAVRAEVNRRYPTLEDVPLRTAWRGALDVATTRTAFIGRAPGAHKRLFYAAGFSGRGLCEAPAVGQAIRDLYLARPIEIDLRPFSPERPS